MARVNLTPKYIESRPRHRRGSGAPTGTLSSRVSGCASLTPDTYPSCTCPEHGWHGAGAHPGRALHSRDAVVTVLRDDNPKREGSASHARYAMLRFGMTVAEYLAATGPRGGRTLRKAVRQGHVRVGVESY